MSGGYGWKQDVPDDGPWADLPERSAAPAPVPTQVTPVTSGTPVAPVPPAAAAAAAAADNEHPDGRGRIVVADDERFFAEALADMLADEGYLIVGIANNGAEAVDAARTLEPHAILMDLRMPVMDGIDAARIITAELPLIQVLMLSAYEEAALREEATGSGVYCYLVKGCRPELVIEMVGKALERRTILARQAAAAAQLAGERPAAGPLAS